MLFRLIVYVPVTLLESIIHLHIFNRELVWANDPNVVNGSIEVLN